MDKHFLFPASVCFELLVQKQTDINKIKCTCKQEIRVVLKHKLLDLIGEQTPELFKRNPPLQKRIINHSLLCLPYATHFKVKPERTRLPYGICRASRLCQRSQGKTNQSKLNHWINVSTRIQNIYAYKNPNAKKQLIYNLHLSTTSSTQNLFSINRFILVQKFSFLNRSNCLLNRMRL